MGKASFPTSIHSPQQWLLCAIRVCIISSPSSMRSRSPTTSSKDCLSSLSSSFLTRLEDAGRDELVDLGRHPGVVHGFLPRSAALGVVGRQVLNRLPHHGVGEDHLDLGVGHSVRRPLFALVLCHAPAPRVDLLHGLLQPLHAQLVALVKLEPFLVRLHGLVVLFLQEFDVALARPRFNVLVVKLERFFHLVLRPLEVHDLAQRGGEVVVVARLLWVSLHGFLVLLDRHAPVLRAECRVALFFGLRRQLRVHVGNLVGLPLVELSGFQQALGFLGVELHLRFLEVLDCGSEVFALRVHLSPAHEDLGNQVERGRAELSGLVNRGRALSFRAIVVLHLHVHRRLVVQHRHLARVGLKHGVVARKSLAPLFGLVVRVTFQPQLRHLGGDFFLFAQLLWGRRGGRGSCLRRTRRRRRGRLSSTFPLVVFHALSKVPHPAQLDAQGRLKDWVHGWVADRRLKGSSRVGLQLLDFRAHGRVGHPGGKVGVGGELAHNVPERAVLLRLLLFRFRLRIVDFLQRTRQTRVVRALLQPSLVRGLGLVVLFHRVERRALAAVGLGPVGLCADARFAVFEGGLVVAAAEVGRGAVGVVHVVRAVQLDGLGVHFDRFRKVLGRERSIALGFKRVCFR
mmetsp:Transcript_19174/g.32530  ORF Transcript_19174/g.32530 Transcript_19174/m.32530 type:complete len:626 (-) Transcript_19174:40-1917(-)